MTLHTGYVLTHGILVGEIKDFSKLKEVSTNVVLKMKLLLDTLLFLLENKIKF